MATLGNSHEVLSPELLRSVAIQKKTPAKNRNELYPWGFAGNRWRAIVTDYALQRVSQLNTPSSEQIRELFQDLLGIQDICSTWDGVLDGLSVDQSCDLLDGWIRQRGMIAHGKERVDIAPSDVRRFEGLLRQSASRIETTATLLLQSSLANSGWNGF